MSEEHVPIHVLVSVSDAYVMPLSVMLASLLATNPAQDVVVWLLRLGISDERCEFLRAQVEAAGARLEAVPVDGEAFEGFPLVPYITRETYLRLLAGEVLPRDVRRVLWLDADIVVRGSLRELYDVDYGQNALVACGYGKHMHKDVRAACAELGLSPAGYVNAGVMLVNLDAWREIDLRQRAREVLDSGVPLRYADQDLVNLVFAWRIGQVDSGVWNLRTNAELQDEELLRARNEARIVHWCGKAKPWMFSDAPLADVWLDWYERSPFAGRKLRLISQVGLSRLAARAKVRGAHE